MQTHPLATTPCIAVRAAQVAEDGAAALLYGIAVAAVLHELDLTYIAAAEPPLMPILDAHRAADLWTRMKAYADANPNAAIRQAVTVAYAETRAAMMLRPKMH